MWIYINVYTNFRVKLLSHAQDEKHPDIEQEHKKMSDFNRIVEIAFGSRQKSVPDTFFLSDFNRPKLSEDKNGFPL